MELLRFATAGSVDDGKSTLIGRLLYDSKQIFEDTLDALEHTSRLRGEEEMMLTEDQSTYIPLGTAHRLENPGKIPLHLIEVQSGSYLGEDDIVRLEDSYGRN